MANLSLAKLREAQKANPPKELAPLQWEEPSFNGPLNADGVPILYQREVAPAQLKEGLVLMISEHTDWESRPSVATAGLAPEGSLPLQASPTVPAVAPGGHKLDRAWAAIDPLTGYCRIFPASFPSIADIPQAWKDEFWSCNSQWCHVEGSERHPDFEANLLAVEAQDAVKANK